MGYLFAYTVMQNTFCSLPVKGVTCSLENLMGLRPEKSGGLSSVTQLDSG